MNTDIKAQYQSVEISHSDLFFSFIFHINETKESASRSFVSKHAKIFAKVLNDSFGTSYSPGDLRNDFFSRF